MRIIEANSHLLHFEGRTIARRVWLGEGVLFLSGLLALLLVPERYRFVGLIAWMAIWLAVVALAPRWLGTVVRVTLDSKARRIVWARAGQVIRTLPMADVQQFQVGQLATGMRPYRTYQLFAVLKGGGRITLAVDPNEAEIQRALQLARRRLGHPLKP